MDRAKHRGDTSGNIRTEGAALPFETASILELNHEGKTEDIKRLISKAIEAEQPGFVLYNYGDLKNALGEEEANDAILKAAKIDPATTVSHLESYIDSSEAEGIFKDALAKLPGDGRDGLSEQGFLTANGEGRLFALDADKV